MKCNILTDYQQFGIDTSQCTTWVVQYPTYVTLGLTLGLLGIILYVFYSIRRLYKSYGNSVFNLNALGEYLFDSYFRYIRAIIALLFAPISVWIFLIMLLLLIHDYMLFNAQKVKNQTTEI